MPQARSSRVRDKWRDKAWIVVEAPSAFNRMPIAYIPVTDREKAMGRVVETTLFDLLKQDPQHYSQKLHFQVTEIVDNTAKTILKGQEYSREYLRSLIRRGSTMVSYISEFTTKDSFLVRIYVAVLTQGRVNSSKKHAIRMLAKKVLNDKTSSLTYRQFSQEAVLGKVASDIYNEVKKIVHLRHVGIKKMKLIKVGEEVAVEEPIEAPAELPAEAPAEIEEGEVEKTEEEEAAAPAS